MVFKYKCFLECKSKKNTLSDMAGRNREEFLTPQGKGIWNIPGIGSGYPQQLAFCTQMLNTHGKTLKPTFIGGG